MIPPIVEDFLGIWPLTTGCMVVAVFGMVTATVTLLLFVFHLYLLGAQSDATSTLYFVLFVFLTSCSVADFSLHLLLYFASKKEDIKMLMVCWIYLAAKFVVDMIFIIVILTEFQKLMAIAIFLIIVYGVRIYCFIIVFSTYASLHRSQSTRDQLAKLGLIPMPKRNQVAPSPSPPSRSWDTIEDSSDSRLMPSPSLLKTGSRLSRFESGNEPKKSVTIILPEDHRDRSPASKRSRKSSGSRPRSKKP